MRMLVLLAALASCAKGGVEIIVLPQDPAVTRVTLFVGVGDVMTAPIQPMSSAPLDPILAWARDQNGEADERTTVDRAPVTFQFIDGDVFPVVIAVGWNADGVAISAAVVTDVKFAPDVISRFEMELHPTLAQRNDAFIKLTHWKSMAGPKAGKECVVYEDKPTLKRFAVVTDGDPDCDGWPTGDEKECQPQFFMSYGRPTLEQVACVAPEMIPGTNEQFCTLAGPPCTDGTGQETACRTPSVYCIPATVCQQCNTAGSPGSFDCARDLTRLSSTQVKPTHLHCNIYHDGQGNPCPLVKALGPLADPTLAGRTCVADALRPARITQVGQPWDNKVSYSSTASGTQLDVEVTNLAPNCNFDLLPTGKILAEHQFGAMVAGELDNGRGIAISIVFSVAPSLVGCFNQPPCGVRWPLVNELVDSCVNQAPFPPETTN